MIDLRRIRSEPDVIREALARRGEDFPLDELIELEETRRRLLAEVEDLKARRNRASEAIGEARRRGEDASAAIAEMRQLSQDVKARDETVREVSARLDELLLRLPNVPHPSVPDGAGDEDNVEVRRWAPPSGPFPDESAAADGEDGPKPHWDIGTELGLMDFERGAKVSGTRFVFLTGWGARLERALTNMMLDIHGTEHGYREVFPPFLVNEASMVGTGQLPKFAEDMFGTDNHRMYLIPTAEVPVTNMYRDEILSADQLPIYHVAYSACFRAEAGAHGRDTRGLIRLHQFNKVELVKFVEPEASYDELEKLVRDAETILQRLELPYRVVEVCTGDVGFAAAKKYDPEVWMPSYGRYVEISSCSNFEDFQARRANIRYRPAGGGRPRFVHTLNGSGLAVGRTLAALLENHRRDDGSVYIPPALRPYLGGIERIEAGQLS